VATIERESLDQEGIRRQVSRGSLTLTSSY
jgi:hypothetical protein